MYSGVDAPESIADHMYRMAIMAAIVKDVSLDKGK